MGQLVVAGAQMMCVFGKIPAPLAVIPEGGLVTAGAPVATIMDAVPLMNIPTFGACSSPTNPAVIAALGAPVPCVPATIPPWAPGAPAVLVNGQPALTGESLCACALGVPECISIVFAGQVSVSASP
jgi:hypothetical protein